MDPRLISAVALLIIGLSVCGFVLRVWNTHPINRVFLVGDYLTEKGLRFLLKYVLVTAFAGGLYALAMAAAKFAYVARWRGGAVPADAFGSIEAVFSVWAVVAVLWVVIQLGRRG
jgi:hypothetical protein